MTRPNGQDGFSLIMVIAVIAVLATITTALVALTANTMHSTATDRTQKKAFNLAEAGMDAGQAALWVSWPTTNTAGPPPAVDSTSFRSQFAPSEFPDPKTGAFIDVQFYDDDGNVDNPGIDLNVPDVDQNGNGLMWIVSRAASGNRAAKVMGLVKKIDYQLQIKNGVAIATSGLLDVRGTGNQAVVGLDPPATSATIYDGTYSGNGNSEWESGISKVDGTTPAQITSEIFPTEVLQNLIETAQGVGKVYANQAAIPNEAWSTDPRIIVVQNGGLDAKNIPDTDGSSVWSENHPGILICLNGDMNDTGQKKTIYGIVYLANGIILRGNSEIHGMVIALTSGQLKGTRAVVYNQNVLSNLNKPTTLSVTLVPNTWREVPTGQP
jgi:hypothetical protein